MKTIYQVTFRNGGTFTRKSDRIYTHAWRCHVAGKGWWNEAKFAGSAELAEKAAKSHLKMCPSLWDGYEIEKVSEA